MQSVTSIFLSAVTDEFKSYRTAINSEGDRETLRIHIQEKFIQDGRPILIKINECISKCDAVFHFVGHRTGKHDKHGVPDKKIINALLSELPELKEKLKIKQKDLLAISYTQWEALLAIYHGVDLHLITPTETVSKRSSVQKIGIQEERQKAHLARLKSFNIRVDENLRFSSKNDLIAKFFSHLFYNVAKYSASQIPQGRSEIDAIMRHIELNKTLNNFLLLTKLVAALNGMKISWEIERGRTDDKSPEDSRRKIRQLVEWVTYNTTDQTILPKFLCFLINHNGRKNKCDIIEQIYNKVLRSRNLNHEEISSGLDIEGKLRTINKDCALLFNTDVLQGEPFSAVLKWCECIYQLGPLHNDPEYMLREGRIELENAPAVSLFTPSRIEIFLGNGQLAGKDFRDVSKVVKESVPIILRRKRMELECSRISDPPDIISEQNLGLVTGKFERELNPEIEASVKANGFFFGSIDSTPAVMSKVFWQLSEISLVGIWCRNPKISSDRIIALGEELNGQSVEDLPMHLAQGDHWGDFSLIYDRKGEMFPFTRKDRTRVLQQFLGF